MNRDLTKLTSFPADASNQFGWVPTSGNWDTQFEAGLRGLTTTPGAGNFMSTQYQDEDSTTALSFSYDDFDIEFDVDLNWQDDSTYSYSPSEGTQINLQFGFGQNSSGFGCGFQIYGLEGLQYTGGTRSTWIRFYETPSLYTNNINYSWEGTRPNSIGKGLWTFRIRYLYNDSVKIYSSPTGSGLWIEWPASNRESTSLPVALPTLEIFQIILSDLMFGDAYLKCKAVRIYYITDTKNTSLPDGIGITDPDGNLLFGYDPNDDGSGSDTGGRGGFGGGGVEDGSGNTIIGGRYNGGLVGSGNESLQDKTAYSKIGLGDATGWCRSGSGIDIVAARFDRLFNAVGYAELDLSLVDNWNLIFSMHNNQAGISSTLGTLFSGLVKEPVTRAGDRYHATITLKELHAKLLENETNYNFSVTLQKKVKVVFASGGYSNALNSDIGKAVVGGTSGNSGTLISFNNTDKIWYIKPDTSADTFSTAESITITSGSGHGTSAESSYSEDNWDTISNVSGTTITLTSEYTDEVLDDGSQAVLIIPNPDSTPSFSHDDFDIPTTGTGTIADVNDNNTSGMTTDTLVLVIGGTFTGTIADIKALVLQAELNLPSPPFIPTTEHIKIYLWNYLAGTPAYDLIKDITQGMTLGAVHKSLQDFRIPGSPADYFDPSTKEFTLKVEVTQDIGTPGSQVTLQYCRLDIYTDPLYDNFSFKITSKTGTTLTSDTNFATAGVAAGDTIVIGKLNNTVLISLAQEFMSNYCTIDISGFVGYTSADFQKNYYKGMDAIKSVLKKEQGYIWYEPQTNTLYMRPKSALTNIGLTFSNVDTALFPNGIQVGIINASKKEGDDYYAVEVLGASYKGLDGQDIQVRAKKYRTGSFGTVLRINDPTILSQTEADNRAQSELDYLDTVTPEFSLTLVSNKVLYFQFGYLYNIQFWGSNPAYEVPLKAIHGDLFGQYWSISLTFGWSTW